MVDEIDERYLRSVTTCHDQSAAACKIGVPRVGKPVSSCFFSSCQCNFLPFPVEAQSEGPAQKHGIRPNVPWQREDIEREAGRIFGQGGLTKAAVLILDLLPQEAGDVLN